MPEEEEATRRRSSGRSRKSPQRFVAGAAGSRIGGDFSASQRKTRPRESLQPPTSPPETLVHRRVAVLWARCKKWYRGTVSDYSPEKGDEAFTVVYDDGDSEKGVFGSTIFRTKTRDAQYEWLRVDTERPAAVTGATQQSDDAMSLPTRSSQLPQPVVEEEAAKEEAETVEEKNVTPAAQPVKETPKAQAAGEEKQQALTQPLADGGIVQGIPVPATILLGQPKAAANAGSSLLLSLLQPKLEPEIRGDSDKPGALVPAAGVGPEPQVVEPNRSQSLKAPTAAKTAPAGQAARSAPGNASAGRAEGRRKKALDVNAAAPRAVSPGQHPKASTAKAPAATQTVGARAVPVFKEVHVPGLEADSLPATNGHSEGVKGEELQTKAVSQAEDGVQLLAGSQQKLAQSAGLALKGTSPQGLPDGQTVSQPQQQRLENSLLSKVDSPVGSPKLARKSPEGQRQESDAKRQKLTGRDQSSPAVTPKLLIPDEQKTKPRTTSIAAPRSLSILPRTSFEAPEAPKSPEEPEYEPQEPEPEASGLTDNQVQADIICSRMEGLLAGLTRARDSIGRATSMALSAARVNAAPRVIRLIADAVEKVDSPPKRIDLLYLVDSILQGCQREGKPDCGPGSAAADAFPRVVAAALPRLVSAVLVSAEGVEKASKVLTIWKKRRLVSESLLHPQLAKLEAARETLMSLPQQPARAPSAKAQVPANTGRRIQLDLGAGTGNENVSAVLEDQYGTHNRAGEGAGLLKREDSSDSDDEPDEHEREVRAQAEAAKRQELRAASGYATPGSQPIADSVLMGSTGALSAPRSTVPWASGTELGARSSREGPPGFSPDSFNPMRIPLKRTPSSRVISSLPPQAAMQERRPSGGSSGYRAPAVSTFASSFGDEDRLDMAGAGDRTFEEQELPPLPPEPWDNPPLPEEEAPPLPPEDEQPPLPAEPPSFQPGSFAGVAPFPGSDEMEWESGYMMMQPPVHQQQQHFYPPRPAPLMPPPQSAFQPGSYLPGMHYR